MTTPLPDLTTALVDDLLHADRDGCAAGRPSEVRCLAVPDLTAEQWCPACRARWELRRYDPDLVGSRSSLLAGVPERVAAQWVELTETQRAAELATAAQRREHARRPSTAA